MKFDITDYDGRVKLREAMRRYCLQEMKHRDRTFPAIGAGSLELLQGAASIAIKERHAHPKKQLDEVVAYAIGERVKAHFTLDMAWNITKAAEKVGIIEGQADDIAEMYTLDSVFARFRREGDVHRLITKRVVRFAKIILFLQVYTFLIKQGYHPLGE